MICWPWDKEPIHDHLRLRSLLEAPGVDLHAIAERLALECPVPESSAWDTDEGYLIREKYEDALKQEDPERLFLDLRFLMKNIKKLMDELGAGPPRATASIRARLGTTTVGMEGLTEAIKVALDDARAQAEAGDDLSGERIHVLHDGLWSIHSVNSFLSFSPDGPVDGEWVADVVLDWGPTDYSAPLSTFSPARAVDSILEYIEEGEKEGGFIMSTGLALAARRLLAAMDAAMDPPDREAKKYWMVRAEEVTDMAEVSRTPDEIVLHVSGKDTSGQPFAGTMTVYLEAGELAGWDWEPQEGDILAYSKSVQRILDHVSHEYNL